MKIGGFLKQSFIDYPGNIASVIFTSGCNFRCFYCHNPDLVLPERIQENQFIEESEIFDYLLKNKSFLDAVVITGGEPTIHQDLPEFIKKIKGLNLLVKLDTNGTDPDLVKSLINREMVDYIAMDVKSTFEINKYKSIVGEQFNSKELDRIKESVNLIINSGIKFEFRTTLVKPFHSFEEIEEISSHLSGNYYLQQCRPLNSLNHCNKNFRQFKAQEIEEWRSKITKKEININYRTI